MNKVLQSILILSLTIIAAKAVPELSAPFYYVSPTGDNTANGSLEAPFQSITHAIDTINASESKSGTVYITPGTYSLSEIHDNHSLICITNQIALVGTTGDPNDVVIQRVNISSARVAYINHQNALVQGITMKDGLLNNTQHNCGANVYINEQGGTINNCIIDNGNGNAYNGYAGNIYALGGHILNSIVKNGKTGNNWDNGVGGILAKNTIIENCIIYKNSGTKINTASAVRLVGDSLLLNCTIVGNVVSRNGGYTILVEDNSKVINSIFYNNVTEDNFPCENFSGNLNNVYNCAIDREFTSGTANVQMPYGPFFVDSKNQNFNLTLISPALDAGMSHNEIISQFGITPHSTDIVGTPRDNMVDIGAYELNTPVFTTYFDISTTPETVGEHTFDFFVKSRGGSGNISYTWDFGDNTIENSTAETISHKFTTPGVYTVKVIARDAQSNSTEFTRTDFIIIRNPIIYVDQNNANPLWPYDTPETAITSISSAIEQAVDGMTVVILNSLYNNSTKEQIIVDKPITISGATGNPADTIIKNTASKTANLFAIKIANANAVVRNLTYHGTQFAAWDVDAAPFFISQAGGTFSNCVFRSGILQGAYYQHPLIQLYGGTLTHCVVTNNIIENRVTTGHSSIIVAQGNSRVENCLIANNSRRDSPDCFGEKNSAIAITINSDNAIVANNTIVKNTERVIKKDASTGICIDEANSIYVDAFPGAYVVKGTFANNVIAGNELRVYDENKNLITSVTSPTSYTLVPVINCASDDKEPLSTTSVIGTTDTLFKNFANDDYYPAMSSPLINKGVNGISQATLDLGLRERIKDSRIDIGAYESESSCTIIIFK